MGGGVRLPVPASVTDPKSAHDWHAKVRWQLVGNNSAARQPLCGQLVFPRAGPRRQNQPDLFYFRRRRSSVRKTGSEFVAHYYNANIANHGGKLGAPS